MNAASSPPTRYRFWVLAVLCSLAFLTYLDRICIMRVQGDIERDLGFAQLTQADEQSLRERGLEHDPQARAKLEKDRATERMSWCLPLSLPATRCSKFPAGGWAIVGARVPSFSESSFAGLCSRPPRAE